MSIKYIDIPTIADFRKNHRAGCVICRCLSRIELKIVSPMFRSCALWESDLIFFVISPKS